VLSAFLIQCLKLNPSTLLVYQELLNDLRQIIRQEDLAIGFRLMRFGPHHKRSFSPLGRVQNDVDRVASVS